MSPKLIRMLRSVEMSPMVVRMLRPIDTSPKLISTLRPVDMSPKLIGMLRPIDISQYYPVVKPCCPESQDIQSTLAPKHASPTCCHNAKPVTATQPTVLQLGSPCLNFVYQIFRCELCILLRDSSSCFIWETVQAVSFERQCKLFHMRDSSSCFIWETVQSVSFERQCKLFHLRDSSSCFIWETVQAVSFERQCKLLHLRDS